MTESLYDKLNSYCSSECMSISKFCRIAVMEKLQRDAPGRVPSAFSTVKEAIDHYRPWDVEICDAADRRLDYYCPEKEGATKWDDCSILYAYYSDESMALTITLDELHET